jgi:hypothetical protein
MMHTVRFVGGLVGGVTGVMSWLLQIYLAVTVPQDAEFKKHVLAVSAVLGAVAIVGIVVYAVCDFLRGREEERRDRAQDAKIEELLGLLAAQAAQAAPKVPDDKLETTVVKTLPAQAAVAYKYLYEAAFALAKEMRTFLDSIPSGLSQEEEHNRVFEPFLRTFWPRLRDIKDRLENVLPRGSVVPSTQWLPTTKDGVQQTADKLEREAQRVDKTVLS